MTKKWHQIVARGLVLNLSKCLKLDNLYIADATGLNKIIFPKKDTIKLEGFRMTKSAIQIPILHTIGIDNDLISINCKDMYLYCAKIKGRLRLSQVTNFEIWHTSIDELEINVSSNSIPKKIFAEDSSIEKLTINNKVFDNVSYLNLRKFKEADNDSSKVIFVFYVTSNNKNHTVEIIG